MRRWPCVALVALLPAAGCSADDDEGGGSPPEEARGRPAVTADESYKVLKGWTDRHNRALTSGDAKDWADTVTGALAGPVTARAKVYGRQSRSSRIALRNPVMYVPRVRGYPKWFAAAALEEPERGKEQQVLGLFVRGSGKEGWRAAHWLTFKGKPPDVALDPRGYAIPAPHGGVAAAHASYLNTGRAAGFAPDAFSARSRVSSVGGWSATSRFAGAARYALRTRDGGALVWYDIEQRQSLAAGPGGTARTLPVELRNYLIRSEATAGTRVEAVWTWLAIGYAPSGGRSSVLGESVSLSTAAAFQ